LKKDEKLRDQTGKKGESSSDVHVERRRVHIGREGRRPIAILDEEQEFRECSLLKKGGDLNNQHLMRKKGEGISLQSLSPVKKAVPIRLLHWKDLETKKIDHGEKGEKVRDLSI